MATARNHRFLAGQICQRRTALMVAAACAAALGLAGCGSDSKPVPSTGPSTSAAPSPDPSAAAKQAVLAAYQGMFDAEIKALNTGTLAGSDIETYAWETQLANIKGALFQDMQSAIVMIGQPAYTVQKTTVDLTPTPHTATITLCWDNRNWTPIDKTTRKSMAAPGQPKRYIMTAELRTVGSRWVVINGTTERGAKC